MLGQGWLMAVGLCICNPKKVGGMGPFGPGAAAEDRNPIQIEIPAMQQPATLQKLALRGT